MSTPAPSLEKLQLEKEIAQLVRDNPTPKFLGSPIDSDLRIILQAWAAQRKILGEKRQRLEMILEEERIQEVLRELGEMHPQKKYECAICLEDMTDCNRCILVCCGQGTCRGCAEDNETRNQSIKIKRCPLCRHDNFGGSGQERYTHVLKFAEKGEAWAQSMMGDIYMGLDIHVGQKKVNKIKAKKWYGLAKEQDFAEAIFKCARLMTGKGGEENPRYRQQLKTAAEKGEKTAATELAVTHWMDGKGSKDSFKEVQYYASISLGSISNAKKNEYLSTILGMALSMKLDATSPELYRAKFYFDVGAKKNFNCLPLSRPKLRSLVCTFYVNTILQLGALEYDGYAYEIPGFSFLPKMRYWANEAGSDNMMSMIAGPDDYGRGGRNETHCANCNVVASPGMKFKQCVRCKAAWYCSKDCQAESWKAGHKSDCKQRF